MRAELRTAPVLYVDDDTVECVINAPHGALILAKDDCGSCAEYEAEIQRLQDRELRERRRREGRRVRGLRRGFS